MSEGDFIIENGVLTEYRGPGGDVTLPSGPEAVGTCAFRGRADIRRVVLPKGLRRIRERSFFSCTALESVTFREGLASIGDAAFLGCSALRSVDLPEGLESFGKAVFANCTALEKAVLPGTLSFVWEEAFCDCASLRTLVIPEGVGIVGPRAFSGCRSLEVLALPESLTKLRESAFAGCRGLRSLRLPRGLAELGDRAFADCRSLRSLDLPEGLPRIGNRAFAGCLGLRSLRLPHSVAELGDRAFADCRSLRSLALPEGLQRIGDGAFADCRALETAALPKSLRHLGHAAFADCLSLRSVDLPGDLEFIGDRAFDRCPALADEDGFLVAGSILFKYSGASAVVTVPDGVTRIARGAIPPREGFTDVRLPESTFKAEEGAFPRQRLILRVSFLFGGLTPALRNCELLCIVLDHDVGVPQRFRRAVRLGAALREPGTPDAALSPEERRWYARYAGGLRREAFELPALRRFLFAHRFLSPVDAERWLEEARAEGSVEQTALLMGYLNELGPEKVEKSRERKLSREVNAAAARARRLAARQPEDGISGLLFVTDPSVPDWLSSAAFRRWLAPQGARLGRTLNEKTDYLVIGDHAADSEMMRAAADLGVPVLTLKELQAMADGRKKRRRKHP